MTQTVGLVRGSTSVTQGTPVTLYTQSGGNATRIMPSLLYFKNSGNNYQGPSTGSEGLYITPSGGVAIPVCFSTYAGGSSQCVPSSRVFYFGSSTNGGVVGSNASAWTYVQPPTNVGAQFSNASTQNFSNYPLTFTYRSNSQNQYGFWPANFWMGPSDVLQFKTDASYSVGKTNYGSSGTLYYEFITVTES